MTEPTEQQNLHIEDTSKKASFGDKISAVFGRSAPNSGFARLILVLAIISLVTVVYFRSSADDEAETVASTRGDGHTERGKKSGVVPERVAKKEIEKDNKAAKEARDTGASFAGARPNTGKKSIDEVLNGVRKPEPEPEPEPPKKAPPASTPVFSNNLNLNAARTVKNSRSEKPTRQQKEGLSPIAAYVQERQKQNDEQPEFSNGVLVAYVPPEPVDEDSETESNDNAAGSNTQSSSSSSPSSSDTGDTVLGQRAGYFSYGVTITAVDTDVAIQDVVGELIGGPLDGARLIGTWSRLGNFYEDLSLTFTRLEFEEEIYSVNLVAFSTDTHLPAFVSEVDRHLLYRWGGLISGALLEAAQAAALASATIENPTSTEALVNATTSLSDDDVRNIFISEAGTRTAEQLKENYQRPITSRVFVGQDMRLLAMEPIYVKRNP